MSFIKEQINCFYPGKNIKVYLFGSRADSTNRERSDYDLAFDIPEDCGDSDFLLTIKDDAPTLCGIDAVNLNKTSPELRNNINKNGVLIYESAKKG
ncbi:MAG: nucleotidyltransferase domain-containing protein [Oligoflexia bacterium]|nr:nucleotidyltransferase domain-containing protein [Oligoflexia bacterium]